MIIGGSSTRNEKNWQSTVFTIGNDQSYKAKKLLGKNDGGYGALYGDEKV